MVFHVFLCKNSDIDDDDADDDVDDELFSHDLVRFRMDTLLRGSSFGPAVSENGGESAHGPVCPRPPAGAIGKVLFRKNSTCSKFNNYALLGLEGRSKSLSTSCP